MSLHSDSDIIDCEETIDTEELEYEKDMATSEILELENSNNREHDKPRMGHIKDTKQKHQGSSDRRRFACEKLGGHYYWE